MPLDPKGTNPLVQLPEVLAVGFTGHRKVPYETKSRQVIRDFLAQQKESHHGVMYGICSAAAGGDQLFAESCIELNIPLRILLPRPAEQFRADFEDTSWQRTVHIMENAISVEVTGRHESRNEQYYDCGIQTVAESQLLVALWDGQPSRGIGGTQEIVSYARKTGHPIAWIHSETGVLQFLNKEALKLIDTSSELEFLNGLPDVGVAAPGIFSLALPAVLRLHARQALWARTRTAAEIARSILVTWRTPRPYEVIGAEVAPWLSGILRSLNFLKMKDNQRTETPLSDFKQEYRRDRVAHQIEYFSRQARKAERQERRYATLGRVCGAVATLIAVACLSGGLQWLANHGFSGRQWLAFAMSALFEIATMAGAFAAMKDCARRRRRYRELSHALRRWDTQLEALNTWNSVLRVVERIERALIVELFEWRSLVLGAGSHKG
jgi:hypothetical protein